MFDTNSNRYLYFFDLLIVLVDEEVLDWVLVVRVLHLLVESEHQRLHELALALTLGQHFAISQQELLLLLLAVFLR